MAIRSEVLVIHWWPTVVGAPTAAIVVFSLELIVRFRELLRVFTPVLPIKQLPNYILNHPPFAYDRLLGVKPGQVDLHRGV